jgi:hypothetical protein
MRQILARNLDTCNLGFLCYVCGLQCAAELAEESSPKCLSKWKGGGITMKEGGNCISSLYHHFCSYFLVLEIESRASLSLDKWSTTEIHHQPVSHHCWCGAVRRPKSLKPKFPFKVFMKSHLSRFQENHVCNKIFLILSSIYFKYETNTT